MDRLEQVQLVRCDDYRSAKADRADERSAAALVETSSAMPILTFCRLRGCIKVDSLIASYYHAGRALEKYFKALALSIKDPGGETETVLNNSWLRTHKLDALARRCADCFPYYGQPEVQAHLKRFSEFD